MDVREYARALSISLSLSFARARVRQARRRYFVNPDEMDGPRWRRGTLVSKDARVVRACENAECLVSWRQFLADISRRHAYRARNRRSSEAPQNCVDACYAAENEAQRASLCRGAKVSWLIDWRCISSLRLNCASTSEYADTVCRYQISFVTKKNEGNRLKYNFTRGDAARVNETDLDLVTVLWRRRYEGDLWFGKNVPSAYRTSKRE